MFLQVKHANIIWCLRVKMLRTVFIMALLLSTLAGIMYLGTAHASIDVNSVPEPSVPEFTLRYVDYSYDIPPVYGVDQYTGETVLKQHGEHVDKRTIEIKIRNQPFIPYTDEENHTINLYYNVQVKGYFGGVWSTLYGDNAHYRIQDYNSQYTIINYTYAINLRDIPTSGKMDFQVQAAIGYESASRNPSTGWMDPYYWYSIVGKESDWSNIQTISIPDGAVSQPQSSSSPETIPTTTPTITPYQEPQQTEQEIIIGVAIIAAIIGAGLGLIVYLIKRK
jgi:hypothetical protein